MSDIEIYRDYTFMDSDDYKYTLSVEDDFTYITYKDMENGRWVKKEELMISTNFAYEIAKKIVAECESNGYVNKGGF